MSVSVAGAAAVRTAATVAIAARAFAPAVLAAATLTTSGPGGSRGSLLRLDLRWRAGGGLSVGLPPASAAAVTSAAATATGLAAGAALLAGAC